MEAVIIIIRIALAIWFYYIGEKRNIGGGWSAALVFLLGLIGIIIVLCSKKKDITFTNEEGE